ncbi:hypothetical protein AYO40_02660 [Planctomycetaceae bacterium SCGC AG-212-D15]|nr:hypothetical protein AYO40_02660 [Planctomycetaceae bacterium SCGC AG-212-D15]
MATFRSRLRLAGLLFVAGLALTGCNPFLLPYLLHGEAKEPATFKQLTCKDKPVKVVVISYAPGTEGTPDGVGADRDLCRKLTKELFQMTKDSKEKIDLVAPRSVDKFKDEHTDWYKMDLKVVGQYFKADYVILLEMEAFDLYESGGLMYRGRTQINVLVQDMSDTIGGEPERKIYKTEYPKERPIPSDDGNVVAFREKFLDHVAAELSWMFMPHNSCSGIASDELR